jgi:hypothetical protein
VYGGNYYVDVFVSKINIGSGGVVSINLSSGYGSDNQAVCRNSPIRNISYNTTGVTGVTFNGLPAGVNGNFNGGVITISGIPSVSGVYVYTVLILPGSGKLTGKINVVSDTCEQIGLFLPNIISPNGDGINDAWCVGVPTHMDLTEYEACVYDVNERLLFRTNNPHECWNAGKAEIISNRVMYFIRYKQNGREERRHGIITIIY